MEQDLAEIRHDTGHDDALEQTELDGDDAELVDELLIEEISIDGMCGVY